MSYNNIGSNDKDINNMACKSIRSENRRTCSTAANYMQKKGDLNNMHACGLSADLLDRKWYR